MRGVRTIASATGSLDPTSDLGDLVADLMELGILRDHKTGQYFELHERMLRTIEGNDFPYDLEEILIWHVKDLRRALRRGDFRRVQ